MDKHPGKQVTATLAATLGDEPVNSSPPPEQSPATAVALTPCQPYSASSPRRRRSSSHRSGSALLTPFPRELTLVNYRRDVALAWRDIDLRSDLDAPDHRHDPGAVYDALDDLLELVRRPAWHSDAACRDHPDLSWFPHRGEPIVAQRAICEACPVRAACADAGMGERHGMWGGYSERDRRRFRRGEPAA